MKIINSLDKEKQSQINSIFKNWYIDNYNDFPQFVEQISLVTATNRTNIINIGDYRFAYEKSLNFKRIYYHQIINEN